MELARRRRPFCHTGYRHAQQAFQQHRIETAEFGVIGHERCVRAAVENDPGAVAVGFPAWLEVHRGQTVHRVLQPLAQGTGRVR